MTDQDDKQQNNPFEAPVTQERRDFYAVWANGRKQ